MVFTCYLCEKESVILSRFCEPCKELKRILSIYGADECRNILKRVCIRGADKREYKIKQEIKDNKDITGDYPKNELSDNSYIKTRSKSK